MRAGTITGMRARPQARTARWSTSRSTKSGFGDAAHRRVLRDAPAVADRRVLRRLPAGHERRAAAPGATIPVDAHRVDDPADLVNNMLRRPYRERLGDHPQRARRRASPAAPPTSRTTIQPRRPGAARDRQGARRSSPTRTRRWRDLTTTPTRSSATSPRNNAQDVARFVAEAHDTATASAERRAQIAASPQRCPGFLSSCGRRWPKLGAADRRADAGARRPQRVRRPARDAARAASARSPTPPPGDQGARRARRDRPAGRCAPRARRSRSSTAFPRRTPELAKNLAIVLQRPRRPQPRGREGPALAGRQGLHRLRGAAAVRLRPGAWRSTSSTPTATCSRSTCSRRRVRGLPDVNDAQEEGRPTALRCAATSAPTSPASRTADPSHTGAASRADGATARSASRTARSAPQPACRGPRRSTRTRRRQKARRGRSRQGREAQASRSRSCSTHPEQPDLPADPVGGCRTAAPRRSTNPPPSRSSSTTSSAHEPPPASIVANPVLVGAVTRWS